jgi:predicted nicotinamide N-methyase
MKTFNIFNMFTFVSLPILDHTGLSRCFSLRTLFLTSFVSQSISDELADKLAGLVAGPVPDELSAAQQKSYVTYTVSSLAGEIRNPAITLLEARNLLSAAGTTGLRTWEASLHLGSYLTTPSCVTPIAGKTVLELGAGTAYVSILCAKFLRAAHVTATDGAEEVVEDMSTNFYLNGLQDAAVINATDLKWGHALVGGEHEAWNAGRQVDVVLAADVTYDNTVLPSLVATMLDLVELFPGVDILLAATIRQERTFGTFMEMCRTAKFTVVEVDYPVTPLGEQRGPYYGDGTPIKICHITKGEAGNWNCMSAV